MDELMDFAADITMEGDDLVITLGGELDIATAPELALVVAAAVDKEPPRLVLDLCDLRFIDSTGLAVILKARESLPTASAMVLRRPQPNVLRVFTITGLDGQLVIEE